MKLRFLVTTAERLVAAVGFSSMRPGLMEFSFGRPSDASVLTETMRNIKTQHLFQVVASILDTTSRGKTKNLKVCVGKLKKKKIYLNKARAPPLCPCVTAAKSATQREGWWGKNLYCWCDVQKNACHGQSPVKKGSNEESKLVKRKGPLGGLHCVSVWLWVSTPSSSRQLYDLRHFFFNRILMSLLPPPLSSTDKEWN